MYFNIYDYNCQIILTFFRNHGIVDLIALSIDIDFKLKRYPSNINRRNFPLHVHRVKDDIQNRVFILKQFQRIIWHRKRLIKRGCNLFLSKVFIEDTESFVFDKLVIFVKNIDLESIFFSIYLSGNCERAALKNITHTCIYKFQLYA